MRSFVLARIAGQRARVADQLQKRPLQKRSFGLILVIVVLVGVVYAVAFALTHGNTRFEFFKAGLQLFTVGVIGGAIAFLYRSIERRSDRDRENTLRRKEFVARLGDEYRSTKAIRSILRGRGLTSFQHDPPGVLTKKQLTSYDEQIVLINQAKNRLESLTIEVESFEDVVSDRDTLVRNLKKMEKYLSGVVTEWEEHRQQREVNFAELRRLDGLTRRDPGAGTFREEFQKPHRWAVAILAKNTPRPAPDLFTFAEVAARIGFRESTVRDWVKRDLIPPSSEWVCWADVRAFAARYYLGERPAWLDEREP